MVQPSEFESTCLEPLPMTFWVNPTRTDTSKVISYANRRDIEVEPLQWNNEAFLLKSKVSLATSYLYALGHIHIQEEVSMIPGVVANSLKPRTILDVCAAPGNKTAQVGIKQLSKTLLIANEPHLGRHSALRANLNRLGIHHAIFTKYDGASFPRLKDKVDLVIADVPCSCEGTLRKSKSINLNQKFVEKLIQTQKAITERAFLNLKVGGHLIYSTCTFNPTENEGVVQHLIQKFGTAIKVRPFEIAQFKHSPGLDAWEGSNFDPQLKNSIRIWPQQNNSGGFFISLLEKCDEV